MFSLVITIISIALVAALALATLYYGGEAFNQGSEKAETSRLLVESQQVESAILLYKLDNGRIPSSLSELAEGGAYLKSIPTGWGDVPGFANSNMTKANLTESACLSFNRTRHSVNVVPSCDDPTYLSMTVCCEITPIYAN